jgi:preprotein translocase subunit SecE
MKFKEIKEKIIGYLKEIRTEAFKVIWPGRNYITAATIVVLIIVFVVTTFVMLIDFGFARFFAVFSRQGIRM